jgi:hypothetical protein
VSMAQSHDKVYAVFVMNFAKYIMWPANKTSGEFVIGVLGNSPIMDELKAAAVLKTIGSQKVMVKDCKSSRDVEGCHLVFVADSKSSLVAEVISRLSLEPTLVVTEKEGLARKGGGISFAESSGKVKFEINKGAIEKKGLSVSSALANLGVVVED